MIQGHLKSQVGRNLFASFLLAALLPLAGLAWYTYQHVGHTLLGLEHDRLKQESKTFGMSLIGSLNRSGSQLPPIAGHDSGMATDNIEVNGFSRIEAWPLDRMHDLHASEIAHLRLGKPLLRVTPDSGDIQMLFLKDERVTVGHVSRRAFWTPDSAPQYFCVLDMQHRPLFCSGELTPPAASAWPAESLGMNAGILPWRSNDTDYLGAFWHARTRAGFDYPGFIVLVANEKAVVLSGLKRFRTIFPAIAVLALALAAALAMRQIRRQTTPLESLTESTRRLATGDFKARVAVASGDEFGDLAYAFNLMADNLNRKFLMLGLMAELDRAILGASAFEHVVEAILNHIGQAVACDGAGILELTGPHSARLNLARPLGANMATTRLEVQTDFERLNIDTCLPWIELELDEARPTCLTAFVEADMHRLYLFPVHVNDRLHSLLVLAYRDEPTDLEDMVRDGRGLADRLAIAASNIAWEETLYRQAHYDALTGLPNRVLLRDRIEQAMAHSDRDSTAMAVILLDLDNFKQVNDSLGHSAGDALLIACAERLRGLARRSDTVARLGGDEFVYLAPGLDRANAPGALADLALRIGTVLSEPLRLHGRALTPRGSLGIALYPGQAKNHEDLLKMADAAMYRAKRDQPGSFRFFSPDMDADAHARFELTQELHSALKNDEFLLYYQPKVEIASGRTVGAEALIRWQSPTRGLVAPGLFIPTLYEIGLGPDLDAWVLDRACRQLREWDDRNLPPTKVSVNISTEFVASGKLVDTVVASLERHGIEAERLELEILESTAVTAFKESYDSLTRLRAMGVSIALDDFGTGYSSLVYLTRIPANVLKIDRAFILDMVDNPQQKTLLLHLIAMAKVLDYTVLAEGVEEAAQADMLADMGCDLIQGYLYGKPVPAGEFERRLLA